MKTPLLIFGFFFYHLSRLYRVSLKKYKTYLVKRNNKNILFVGHQFECNNLDAIVIGENTYINGGEYNASMDGKIIIGKNCMISYGVIMRTDTHVFEDKNLPMIDQGLESRSIFIGDNVWIGQEAYIMPGVTIGNGVIIGARTVVTRDVPDNAVIVGVPGRIIRYR